MTVAYSYPEETLQEASEVVLAMELEHEIDKDHVRSSLVVEKVGLAGLPEEATLEVSPQPLE